MADTVSKVVANVGWGLLAILGVIIGGGILYSIVLLFVAPMVAIWLKLLVAIGLLGGAFLLFSVIRDRWLEVKKDKYKDIEV